MGCGLVMGGRNHYFTCQRPWLNGNPLRKLVKLSQSEIIGMSTMYDNTYPFLTSPYGPYGPYTLDLVKVGTKRRFPKFVSQDH
jgi:hypothetical protein